jgi:ABC-type uncharacterized transport system permease subunit
MYDTDNYKTLIISFCTMVIGLYTLNESNIESMIIGAILLTLSLIVGVISIYEIFKK